ncbi:MAG: hypothetical protein PHW11_03670 [Anaerolineaceae bacterium]|nr:hypothetical protein [Anaerolineaceae bacterium]MDD4042685.1 hypothetical protein [Anaerolineaceae bacterium]MDD4577783.1 hypothetical protein [Anaerolineaceae bacterium]
MNNLDLLLLLAGLVLSLMVFSYLLGDTLLFGIAMYTLVGATAGFTVLVLVQKVIMPMVITPLTTFPKSSVWLELATLLAALLPIFMIFKKSSRVAGISLGFLGGVVTAALIVGVSRGTLVPQLLSIVDAFDPSRMTTAGLPNWSGIFEAFMMLAGVLAVLFAFHHRKTKQKQDSLAPSWLDGLTGFGQIFIGITFGAIFVGLFSTGLVALIAYVQYLVDFVRLW